MDREELKDDEKSSNFFAMISTVVVLLLAFFLASSPFFISRASNLPDSTIAKVELPTDNLSINEDDLDSELATEEDENSDGSIFRFDTSNNLSNNLVEKVEKDQADQNFSAQPSIKQADQATEVRPVVPAQKVAQQSVKPAIKAAVPKVEYQLVPAYWVQIASFSSIDRARDARQIMATRGVSAHIETITVAEGKTMYRLRAGAWSSEDEAKRFMMIIQSVKNFESAYITKSMISKKV